MAYLYRHIRLDKNEPFYIGIGSDRYFKRSKNTTHRNDIWKRIFNKTPYRIEILFDDMPLHEIKEKEKEFISLYGRIDNKTGILANLSAGGDGMFDVTQSVRDKISKATSGKNNPFYGKTHSIEVIERMKLNQRDEFGNLKRNTKLSEETKLKIGLANKGKAPFNKGKKDIKGATKRTGINHHTYKGKIECYSLSGELINTFDCVNDVKIHYGLSDTNNVMRVVRGERKSHNGMTFKIINGKIY